MFFTAILMVSAGSDFRFPFLGLRNPNTLLSLLFTYELSSNFSHSSFYFVKTIEQGSFYLSQPQWNKNRLVFYYFILSFCFILSCNIHSHLSSSILSQWIERWGWPYSQPWTEPSWAYQYLIPVAFVIGSELGMWSSLDQGDPEPKICICLLKTFSSWLA